MPHLTPVRLGAATLFVSLLSALIAADPPQLRPPEDLARDLGDPDYHTREAATRQLWQLGEAARPALEKTLAEGPLEAATRAEAVLHKFDWAIRPDTPKDVLVQIKNFRDGSPCDRATAVAKMINLGPAALPALRSLLAKEIDDAAGDPPGSARRRLFVTYGEAVAARVPGLVFDGKADEAEALLALNARGPVDDAVRDLAVFMMARGQSKQHAEAVAKLRALHPDDPGPALALVYAHHAAGDGAKAKALLTHLNENNLGHADRLDALLTDLGEWGELADRPARNPNSADGLKAFRLRLAGQTKNADELLKDLCHADSTDSRGCCLDTAAMGLFLNGRTADALTRLKGCESAPHTATEVLAARLEFAAAFDLIKAGLADDNGTIQGGTDGRTRTALHTMYKLRKARLLAQVGERDAALQLFAALDDISETAERSVQTQLVRAAMKSGFADVAAGYLGRIQARREESGGSMHDPYEAVFEADADAARLWWQVVRHADPKENAAESMKTVRAILTGRLKPERVGMWIDTADEYVFKCETADHDTPVDPQRRAVAVAAAWRAVGQTAKAVAALEAFVDTPADTKRTDSARGWVFGLDESFRLWIDLSDWLTELGKPADAAKRLEQGWRRQPANPVLLYLSGKALLAAGDKTEGERRMAVAHLVPLGNAQLRARFLDELIGRGDKPAMRTELKLLREAAWAADASTTGNVWNQVGRAATALGEFGIAADAQRRAMHFVLKTNNIVYVDGAAYANVPALARGLDARKLVADGKVKEGLAAADEAFGMMPTHADTVRSLCELLDARGDTADADALFAKAWERYTAALKANPKSGWLKQQAAALAAGCRREKGAALKLATEAADDDPDSRPVREALAEAHFRNGDRDKAGEVMAGLMKDDRRNWHYKRQAERYKNAAFDSPLP